MYPPLLKHLCLITPNGRESTHNLCATHAANGLVPILHPGGAELPNNLDDIHMCRHLGSTLQIPKHVHDSDAAAEQ